MKKIIAVLLTALMLFSCAAAEVDLKSFSYDELIALRKQLDAEIISRPEWKEVTVPSGVWTVGEDIPAGSYSLSIGDSAVATITIWEKTVGDYSGYIGMYSLSEKESVGKITFREGNILEISKSIKFAPPITLGF